MEQGSTHHSHSWLDNGSVQAMGHTYKYLMKEWRDILLKYLTSCCTLINVYITIFRFYLNMVTMDQEKGEKWWILN